MELPLFNIRVGFSHSPVLGAVIQAFTGGDVNHALIIYRDPVFDIDMTLGANPNGLTKEPLRDFVGNIVHVYYPNSGPGLLGGLRMYVDLLNAPYDYKGLFGMSMVEVAHQLGVMRFKNPGLDAHKLFCSEYCTMVCRASGYNELPDVPAGSVDPAELSRALAADSRFTEVH